MNKSVYSLVLSDEVVDAMHSVGRALPEDLRETGRGGLAGTPTGIEIRKRMNGGQEKS